ncbi:MAG: hypothetical protein WBA28_09250 [Microbacteriaceae bacterium]
MALGAAAILAMTLAGCAPLETDEEVTVAPIVPQDFHVLETAGGLLAMSAPDGEKVTDTELNGVFSAVGLCLGMAGTEQGDLTVVWPTDTLALTQKAGIEFDAKDWEGDPVRTRLNLNDPVVIAGTFVRDAPWFEKIPEGCAIPEAGVFVISNAHHPAPPVEETPAPEEETQG